MVDGDDGAWARAAAAGAGLAGVAAVQAGVTDAAGLAADALLVVAGWQIARWEPRDARATWRAVLRWGALPALVALLAFAAYANLVADGAELSRLRGTLLWSHVGLGDVHAATTTDLGWVPTDGRAPADALWVAAAALRFLLLWTGLRLVVGRATAGGRGDAAVALLVAAASLVGLHLALTVALDGGVDGLGRAVGAPQLRSLALPIGAAGALLARRIPRSVAAGPWLPRAGVLAVAWSLLADAGGGPTGAVGSLAGGVGVTALLVAAGNRPTPAAVRPAWVRTAGATTGPALLLLGPAVATCVHASLPPPAAAVVGLGLAAAAGFAVQAGAGLLLGADRDPADVALWLVPSLVLATMLLLSTTGALGWVGPQWVTPGAGGG